MSNFKDFQNKVKSLHGVWASDDVCFTQTKDGYQAAYKPEYPNSSDMDMIINDIQRSGAYLRGNYELIRKWGGRFRSFYFEDLDGTVRESV